MQRQGYRSLIVKVFFLSILFIGVFILYQKPELIYEVIPREPKLFGLNSVDVLGEEKEKEKESKIEESTQPETIVQKPKELLIREAFGEKYDKSINVIAVEISQDMGEHVKGLVDLDSLGLNATFYARKLKGVWEIAAVQNGVVNCADANLYKFPVEMIPECFDLNVGDVVVR